MCNWEHTLHRFHKVSSSIVSVDKIIVVSIFSPF